MRGSFSEIILVLGGEVSVNVLETATVDPPAPSSDLQREATWQPGCGQLDHSPARLRPFGKLKSVPSLSVCGNCAALEGRIRG